MKKLIILIVMFVLLTGLYVLTQAEQTVNHERVHELNCIYNGGSATVSYGFMKQSGLTLCNMNGIDAETYASKHLLDVQNEIVTYNLQSIIGSMYVIAFVFLCLFAFVWIGVMIMIQNFLNV